MNKQQGPVMSVERAKIILDTFGSDDAAWPESEREVLRALLATNDELQAAWREAAALDRVLAAGVIAEPSSDLISRMVSDAARVQSEHMRQAHLHRTEAKPHADVASAPAWRQLLELLWPYGSPSIPAGALAASIVLGVSVGTLSVETQTTITDNSAYEMVAYAVGDAVLAEDWQ